MDSTNDVVGRLIETIRSQERKVTKLERKLGRRSWHLNQARTALGKVPVGQDDLRVAREHAKLLKQTLAERERRIQDLERQLAQVRQERDAARIEVGSLRRTLSGFNEERERLTGERERLVQVLEERAGEAERYQQALAQMRAEHDQARVPECLELVGKEEPYELFDAVEGLMADGSGKEKARARLVWRAPGENGRDGLDPKRDPGPGRVRGHQRVEGGV